MFSFHKPKVYRSSTGCCICKAKSSSSRFTDSKKYEEDFIECFQLEERRTGEICNACVLLVKRWKKLPAGSNRNWRHVVDARAGPGIKSLTKFKSKNKNKKLKETTEKFEKIMKKKHIYLKPDREQSPAMSDDLTEEYVARPGSKGSSRAESPDGSEENIAIAKRLTIADTDKEDSDVAANGFIDLSYFKRETICCGTIFKGLYGEIIIDRALFKPCIACLTSQRRQQQIQTQQLEQQQLTMIPNSNSSSNSSSSSSSISSPSHSSSSASASPAHSSASASPAHSSASASPAHETSSDTNTITKPGKNGFCDSSSDSGYDESSNHGINETKSFISRTKILPISLKSTQIVKEATLTCSSSIQQTVRFQTTTTAETTPESLKLIPIVTNPLVDFALHASTRQSISN